MKATGIVRRIDDLGRIVIPREIRRNLRIKEGDPLEIFTTTDGEVVFKKYQMHDDVEWQKAKEIVKTFTDLPFALYNNYGDIEVFTKMGMPNYYDNRDGTIYNTEGDIAGFIYIDGDILTEEVNKIKKVLKAFLSEY